MNLRLLWLMMYMLVPLYHWSMFVWTMSRMPVPLWTFGKREIACKQTHDMKPNRAVLQGHRHQSKPTHGLCSWTIRRGAGCGENAEGSSISQISSCNDWRCSSEMCDVWCQDTRDFPSSFGKGCDWRGKDGQWKDLGIPPARPGDIFWIPGYLSWC